MPAMMMTPTAARTHLQDEFEPVDAWGGREAQGRCKGCADQGRDDPDPQSEPDRDVLLARCHQPTQRADDQPDDERRDDSSDLRRISYVVRCSPGSQCLAMWSHPAKEARFVLRCWRSRIPLMGWFVL